MRELWTSLEPVIDPSKLKPGDDAGRAVVSAIIPCLDEEEAIAGVVRAVRAHGVSEVIVVDSRSNDRTVERATLAGARVVVEPERGYGRAIQAGVAAVRPDADILLFIDGDGSDRAEFIPALIGAIADRHFAFVQGSRLRGTCENGSLSLPQITAGYVGGLLLRLVYDVRFTDLSPF